MEKLHHHKIDLNSLKWENLHTGTQSSTVHGHLRYTVTYGTRQKNIIDAILGLYRFVTASHNGTRNQKNNVHLRF